MSSDHLNLDKIEMTVQELLTEMKDISEVIIDLAYASLLYNSEEMADKVRELDHEMNDLKYVIRMKMLFAARTREDAKQLSGVLQVASAADQISHAASEIVNILNVPVEKRPFLPMILNESEEKIKMTKINPSSSMAGNTLEDLEVEACTGMRIIAIKNRHGWTYDPEENMKLRAGDDIIVRGSEDGFNRLVSFTSGKEGWTFPQKEEGDQ